MAQGAAVTQGGVESKLRIIRENLERLSEIAEQSFEEFTSDFRNLDSALHRLQTTIQALIDVASFVSAQRGLAPPRTSRDLLEHLEAAGHLPMGATDRFGPIFGFRNRIVHLYERVDERIVYRIVREERGDLAELIDLLLAALDVSDPQR